MTMYGNEGIKGGINEGRKKERTNKRKKVGKWEETNEQ